MSIKKITWASALIFAIIASTSCKEKDEETTKLYLDGTLTISVDRYILPNTTVTIDPTGVTHPEGNEIGYCFKVTPGMDVADTVKFADTPGDKTISYTFGDSLGMYTISVTAFATGYSSSYASKNISIVDPSLDGTVKGTGILATDPHITDSRDGSVYYYTGIESDGVRTDWFRNNLAYKGAGVPYLNEEIMSEITGRYYNWEEARTACPEGWRLPGEADWVKLAKALGDKDAEAKKDFKGIAGALMADGTINTDELWEFWPEVKITNSSKLVFLPFGYLNIDGDRFTGFYNYAAFWTADSIDENGQTYGLYRYIVNKGVGLPDVLCGKADTKSFGTTIRCVRDAE